MIILDMDMPKCCSDCDLCYDMATCSVSGVDRDDDWYDIMDKKRMDSCPIIAEIPDNPTNGDVFKALYPNVGIVHLIRENKRVTELSDEWWDMPYKGGEKL